MSAATTSSANVCSSEQTTHDSVEQRFAEYESFYTDIGKDPSNLGPDQQFLNNFHDGSASDARKPTGDATTSRGAQKLAFQLASYNFHQRKGWMKFNLRRSFDETGGDTNQLLKDIAKIIWALYRKYLPTMDHYRKSVTIRGKKTNYSNTPRDLHQKHLASISSHKRAVYREDRVRGAVKRRSKEEDQYLMLGRAAYMKLYPYRNVMHALESEIIRLGMDAFTKRMHEDQEIARKKGGSDKKTLEFLAWYKNEKKDPRSPFFTTSSRRESDNVKKASSNPTYSGKKTIHLTATADDLVATLKKYLPTIRVELEMTEDTSSMDPFNFSKQFIWSSTGITQIVSAERKLMRSGYICWYATHPTHGLLVSFSSSTTGFYNVYPPEHQCFNDYTDPVTGTFMGNPKLTVQHHRLHTVKGKLKATIRLPGATIVMNTGGYGTLKSSSEIDRIIRENNMSAIDAIEARLKGNIQRRHDANKATGTAESKRIHDLVDKKVSKAKRPDLVAQLTSLGKLFDDGILTKHELDVAKAKILSA
jgi:hypothetical protein